MDSKLGVLAFRLSFCWALSLEKCGSSATELRASWVCKHGLRLYIQSLCARDGCVYSVSDGLVVRDVSDF